MRTPSHLFPIHLALAMFAASCTTMQPTAGVQDDIYYMPSDAPVASGSEGTEKAATQERSVPEKRSDEHADDYYDPNTAQHYSDRNYYDMAYNDPYYYNYGRFGFNSGMGMGWQNGWSGPGWGMGMGYGYGYPMGSGWSMSMSYGYGSGFYDPWYGGYSPYGNYWGRPMGYSPYGFYDPYYGGYGAGNYYGPYGSCYACYTPVVVGGSSGVVVGHRPSIGSSSSNNSGNPVNQQRHFRDPVGLSPEPGVDGSERSYQRGDRSAPIYNAPTSRPERSIFRNNGERGNTQNDRSINIDRSGGFDRNDSSPSRSGGGGGSRPVTSPRPR